MKRTNFKRDQTYSVHTVHNQTVLISDVLVSGVHNKNSMSNSKDQCNCKYINLH